MQKVSVLVGAEIGVAIGGGKTPCITTEYAHRWNSYGLQHVMEIEDEKDSSGIKGKKPEKPRRPQDEKQRNFRATP